jgi:hypothetical protein
MAFDLEHDIPGDGDPEKAHSEISRLVQEAATSYLKACEEAGQCFHCCNIELAATCLALIVSDDGIIKTDGELVIIENGALSEIMGRVLTRTITLAKKMKLN